MEGWEGFEWVVDVKRHHRRLSQPGQNPGGELQGCAGEGCEDGSVQLALQRV